MPLLAYRVLATLAYSAQFQQPLTLEEIELRLVGKKPAAKFFKLLFQLNESEQVEDNKGCPQESVAENIRSQNPVFKKLNFANIVSKKNEIENLNNQELRLANLCSRLKKLELISTHSGNWVLTKALDSLALDKLVSLKQERCQNSLKLKKSLKPLLKFAQHCSWVKAAAVTGSAAVKSADRGADVDLMIIVKANRLWLARWVLLGLSLLLGKKRWPWEKGGDDWCFNLFLDERALALPENKHSLYFSYEACQIDWMYDSVKNKSRFYQSNQWISAFLPNWYLQLSAAGARQNNSLEENGSTTHSRQKKDFSALKENCFLNNLAFNLQKKHLHQKNKIPYDNLNIKQAFLHGPGLPAGWK